MKKIYTYACKSFDELIDDIFAHNEGDYKYEKAELDRRVDEMEDLLYNFLEKMLGNYNDTDEEYVIIAETIRNYEYLYDNIGEYPEHDGLKESYGHLDYDSSRRWSLIGKWYL